MAKFKITPKTTVAELKEQFSNEVGGVLRIYEGRSEAADTATLVSLGAKEGELECRTSRTVGKFEEAFQNDLNLKVKVYTKDNWVKVLDGITLASAAELPNGMTKAKMEEYLSYQRAEKEDTAEVVEEPTIATTKKIRVEIYGEGVRLDVYGYDDNLEVCHNALRDAEYFSIKVIEDGTETSYSLDDLGATVYPYEWPEDIFDDKFINPAYKQYEGKEPSDVFDFEGCDLYDAEEEGFERIEMIQTKIEASVDLELGINEKFDPKKLHFIYSEFVVPGAELEVNTAVVYNGKQYPIELDIDSEREIDTETIWENGLEE